MKPLNMKRLSAYMAGTRGIRRRYIGLAVFILLLLTIHFVDVRETSERWPWHLARPYFRSEPAKDSAPHWSSHPVVALHKQALEKFDALVQRQSKTPDEAEVAYERRYGRKAPPAYRRWVEEALARKSPIIDDFDALTLPVHRFAQFSPAEIKETMRKVEVANGDYDKMGRCKYGGAPGDRRFNDGCRHWSNDFTRLLNDHNLRDLVPDVEFFINFLDEASVLVTDPALPPKSEPAFDMLANSSIADSITKACSVRGASGASSTPGKRQIDPKRQLTFLEDPKEATDVCNHPEYASQNGFIMCPTSLRQMKSLAPIVSSAAPAPFSDIIIPPTYYSLRGALYKPKEDWSWAAKENKAYWAGSNTGGRWSEENWRKGLRQRLVSVATGTDRTTNIFLGPPSEEDASAANPAALRPYRAPADDSAHQSRFDVSITRVMESQCMDKDVCNAQRDRFLKPPPPGTPKVDHNDVRPMRYRLQLDVDGNSYTGRFYRMLAGVGTPLKATIFREWHDDRLVPWLHYVPVTQSLEELPELVRFMLETEQGQSVARAIGQAGSDWYKRALEPVHQGLYMYRLMIELAWLTDESRTTR